MMSLENDLVSKIHQFVESEAQSCAMDFGCITPLYVYRMWGGVVSIDDIAVALKQVQQEFVK